MKLKSLLERIEQGTATPEDVQQHLAESEKAIAQVVERALAAEAREAAQAAPLRGLSLISQALRRERQSATDGVPAP